MSITLASNYMYLSVKPCLVIRPRVCSLPGISAPCMGKARNQHGFHGFLIKRVRFSIVIWILGHFRSFRAVLLTEGMGRWNDRDPI